MSGGGKIKLTKDGRIYFKGIKKYGNGDIYDGEFVDGMRHGVGKMKLGNGDRYEGEFQRNCFHGFGVHAWNTVIDDDNNVVAGRRYEGEWKDGLKHGKGIYYIGNGDVYSGSFVNDYYDGKGLLKVSSGESYDGMWARGKPNGHMKIIYENGDVYEGSLMAGIFEGKGKMTFKNDLGSLEGDWHCGKPHGKCVRVYADTSRFVGDFFEGEIHGEGMMFFANGDQYLGEWKNGHISGRGVYNYNNGDSYEGMFLKGFRYGEGKYRYKDGGYYQGEYRNVQRAGKNSVASTGKLPLCDGKRHGTGIRVWTTGARYEGQWLEDKMHGGGTLTSELGAKYEGRFCNGLRSGKGEEQFGNTVGIPFICPLGCKHGGSGYCTYVGDYRQGLFHGYGELKCMSGLWYKGQFRRGKKEGQGEQYFIRDGENGDPDNLFIGGLGSLYRMKLYKGEYIDDVRHGNGIMTYTNGDTLDGNFRYGLPHGTMVYTFAASGKTRIAKYLNGYRSEWVVTRMNSRASSRAASRSNSRVASRSASIASARSI